MKFTKDEIHLIKTALSYVYNKKLDSIALNRSIITKREIRQILSTANKYDILRARIEEEESE